MPSVLSVGLDEPPVSERIASMSSARAFKNVVMNFPRVGDCHQSGGSFSAYLKLVELIYINLAHIGVWRPL